MPPQLLRPRDSATVGALVAQTGDRAARTARRHREPLGAALGLALLACAGACASVPGGEEIASAPRAHALVVVIEQTPVALTNRPWISAWVDAPFAFDELLPSWNTRLPAGGAFRVDVQLDAEDAPWLDLGGWGAWPASQRAATKFDLGRVAIDVVELDGDAERARVRIRTRGLAPGATASLEHLTLCFTRSALHELRAGFGAPPPVATLPVPLRRQTDEGPEIAGRICSPTSVTMVLAFSGVERPTAEVAAALYDEEHDIYGNWNRAVQGAFGFGVPGELVRIDDWPQAAAVLEQGTPLVISIAAKEGQLSGAPYPSTDGHLLVLAGFDGEGHAVCFDPAVPPGDAAPRRYLLEELESIWLRRGGVAYRIGHASASR